MIEVVWRCSVRTKVLAASVLPGSSQEVLAAGNFFGRNCIRMNYTIQLCSVY